MPDLTSRAQHENAIASAILLFLAGPRRAILDDEEIDFFEFRDGMADVLVPPLAAAHEEAATNMARIHGADLDRFRMDAKSVRWATKYSRQLSREVTRSIRDELASAYGLSEPGEFDEAIATIFGRTRSEKIGVTETTSSISIGERAVIDEIERQTGKALLAYWQTEDEGVCKICRGLRNKSESVYRRKFPLGPPAHPWCRCWEEYR